MKFDAAEAMRVARDFLDGDIALNRIRTNQKSGHPARTAVALTTLLFEGWQHFSNKTPSARVTLESLFPCVHTDGTYCPSHTHCWNSTASSHRALCRFLTAESMLKLLRGARMIHSQGTRGVPGTSRQLTLTPPLELRALVQSYGKQPAAVKAFLAGRLVHVEPGMSAVEAIAAELALEKHTSKLHCLFTNP